MLGRHTFDSLAPITTCRTTKRKGNKLTEGQRKAAIDDIIYFFESERDEKIGVIAAESVLDFFLEHIGSKLYNQGIEDASKVLENRVEEMKYDLDELKES